MNRKKIFKLHSWTALFAMIPIVLISITGSILVFKPEIDRWLMPKSAKLINITDQRKNLDVLLENIAAQLPEYEIGTWEIMSDRETSDAIYVIKMGTFDWYKVYFNPYTAKILSPPVPLDHSLTDWLVELHYTFLLHESGIFFGIIFSIALLFLGVSGLIIYRKFWQRLFTLRWNKHLITFFSDFHKMVGIISTPILITLAITGGYWNIAAFVHEISESKQQEQFVLTERRYNNSISFEKLNVDIHKKLEGFKLTYLVFPYEPGQNITFYGSVSSQNPLLSDYASGATYNRLNGDFMTQWDIRESGLGVKTLDSFRSLHFGTFAGLTSRIIWCVLGASPVILALTGGYLWYRRKIKRKVLKSNRSFEKSAIESYINNVATKHSADLET